MPYVVLSLAAALLLLSALERPGPGRFAWAGLLVAAAFLIRQQGLFLAIAGGIWIPLYSRLTDERRTPRSAAGSARPTKVAHRLRAALLLRILAWAGPVVAAVALYLLFRRHWAGTGFSVRPSNLHPFFVEPGFGRLWALLEHVLREGVRSLLTAGWLVAPLLAADIAGGGFRRWRRSTFGIWIVSTALLAAASFLLMDGQIRRNRGWPYLGGAVSDLLLQVIPSGWAGPGAWVRKVLTLAAPVLSGWIVAAGFRNVREVRRDPSIVRSVLASSLFLFSWFPSFGLAVFYDRYLLTVLPAVPLLVVPRSNVRVRTLLPAAAFAFLLAGLSVEGTHLIQNQTRARWEVAEELVHRGIAPRQIRVGWEWEGHHLYEVAVDSLGVRPPFDLDHGYPWSSLVHYRVAISEAEANMEPEPRRTYRAFLSEEVRTVGFRYTGSRGTRP